MSGGRPSVAKNGFLLAVGTLTAVPVPAPSRVGRREAAIAMALAPVVGAALGLAAGGLAAVAGSRGGFLLGGALAVTALALLTRALHLDGLADTVDGLGSGRSAEAARAIMKRGDVGPFGGTALVLVLLLGAGSITGLLAESTRTAVVALVVSCALARAGACVACSVGIPSAATTGLGAQVVGSVPRPLAAFVVLVSVGGAALGLGWHGLAMAAVVALTTALLIRRALARLEGVSGDVLGAIIEVGQVVALLTLLLLIG